MVRMEEMRQSLRILQQAIDHGLPPGPVMVDNPYVALPPKEKVYNEMESLIYHFKLIMDGPDVPAGDPIVPALVPPPVPADQARAAKLFRQAAEQGTGKELGKDWEWRPTRRKFSSLNRCHSKDGPC